MKLISITFLLLLNLFSSCQKFSKYASQLNTVDTLMMALYKSDTAKVDDLTGVNPEKLGEDSEHYRFKVNTTSRFLQDYGMSKMTAYEVKEFPKGSADLIDVIVPLYNKDGLKTDKKITVRFVKFLPFNKIAYFRLEGAINPGNTIAPE